MAHPSRSEFFEYLRERLGDVPFAIDDGCGLIQNCRRAWTMYDPTADYHVVIQDDAIICNDFYNRAVAVLEKANGLPVSFIHISPVSYKKFKADREKNGAIMHLGLSGGVALCLPTKLIPEMLAHYDNNKTPMDDHRVGMYTISKGLNWYFPIPSLVDHRVGNPSVVHKRTVAVWANEYIDRELNKK